MSQQSLPFDEPAKSQIFLPLNNDLAEYTADKILKELASQLPDLSKVHILLSSGSATSQFRSILLNKASELGYSALLGPNIMSLTNWVQQYGVLSLPVLSEHSRELLLVGALQKFSHIYQHSNPWVLAECLMELFDELTLAHLQLPNDIKTFREQIIQAYGATEEVRATLDRETILVHTLWFAMHEQLSELGYLDRTSASLLQLGSSNKFIPPDHKIFYCGIDRPTPAEKQWRQELLSRNQLTLVLHNYQDCKSSNQSNDYSDFLEQVYNTSSASFYDRTVACKNRFPDSPVKSRIRSFAAEGSEDEALAIDIQVRRWLLQGKRNIGIVTENRKLARRVRALLARANVRINDDSGWALSTTSAATVLERWLESIEQDFHYLPFLDFLKSPFVLANDEDFLKTVYQLEQHIVHDENTPNDIAQYLYHIKLRQTKLLDTPYSVNYDGMVDLLQTISEAAEPLTSLHNSKKEQPASDYIDALMESLDKLNVVNSFSQDDAGIQLLSELAELRQAAIQIPTDMSWIAFRSWLGRTLERFNFKPDTQSSPIKITTLANSEYLSFDACVIAGAERDFLPHRSKVSPFFNDAVRAALDVPTQEQNQAINFFLFRRLLCAVDPDETNQGNILITRRSTENGEEIIASPWVAALQAFHQQCYGADLSDSELALLVSDTSTQVVQDQAPLPATIEENPGIAIPAALLPDTLSASAYQQLVNCPYQFFAARCLGLAPPDTVREALQKLDYGKHVHRCVEAFHGPVKGLPGPFKGKITADNRDQAIRLLNEIAETVFESDIQDNFQHRGWLKRWQQIIPLYIDWQTQHQQRFTTFGHEVEIDKIPLSGNISIRGKIDRVDKQQGGFAIIDYKTGSMASKDEIINGEAVQLPFYLLLLLTENDSELSELLQQGTEKLSTFYVDLNDTKKVSAKSVTEDQELLNITNGNRQRLITVMEHLQQGCEAPAWGSPDVCKYCEMDVLCRKQAWTNDQETTGKKI